MTGVLVEGEPGGVNLGGRPGAWGSDRLDQRYKASVGLSKTKIGSPEGAAERQGSSGER